MKHENLNQKSIRVQGLLEMLYKLSEHKFNGPSILSIL